MVSLVAATLAHRIVADIQRGPWRAFYDLPAEHWRHIRSTSTFATIRHRSNRTKNCVPRATLLGLVYCLTREAEKSWQRIHGSKRIADLDAGSLIQGWSINTRRKQRSSSSPEMTHTPLLTIPPKRPIQERKELDNVFFLVGMSRSGTTWLSKCLNLHEDIASFGETLFWGRGYIQPSAQGKYTPQQLQQVTSRLANMRPGPRGDGRGCLKKETIERWPEIIRSGLSESPGKLISPAEVFKRLLSTVGAAEGKKVVVEKTPHHLNWIDRIKQAFPTAKFVATYRDPYQFMLSYKYQGTQHSERAREVFQRQYHPLLAALVWRGYMRSLLHAQEKYPESTLLIPFAEINDNPTGVLERVCLFFGVKPTVEKPLAKENSSFVAPVKSMLQEDDIFWMNFIAKKEMNRAGFAPRRPDPKIGRITWSVLKLPIWLATNLWRWNKRIRGSLVKYIWSWLKSR